jgi:hypothetical protein
LVSAGCEYLGEFGATLAFHRSFAAQVREKSRMIPADIVVANLHVHASACQTVAKFSAPAPVSDVVLRTLSE